MSSGPVRFCAFVFLGLGTLLAGACGDDEDEGPSEEAVGEAEQLQQIIGGDQTPEALSEVDGLVLDDRPVRAAEFLRAGALPASERQLAALRELTVTDPAIVPIHRELQEVQARRVEVLERYAELLARGGDVEDLLFVECLGDQREVADAWVDALDKLSEIRPLTDRRDPRRGGGAEPGTTGSVPTAEGSSEERSE